MKNRIIFVFPNYFFRRLLPNWILHMESILSKLKYYVSVMTSKRNANTAVSSL